MIEKKKGLTKTKTMILILAAVLTAACSGGRRTMPKAIADSIALYRDSGKTLRNDSRFGEALEMHLNGLHLAKEWKDTTEWVKALNNIGTDYRRLGILDEAQTYHYEAWRMSESCADTSSDARKNRVVSLNGLGNIYLTMGNLERADSALRMALAGEKELHSETGMAINYANIGSIFKSRGQIDSAWTYFRKSMEMNRKAKNVLGISLCHTYYGSIFQHQHQYADAEKEYEKAYLLMSESKDDWHALNSLIALADINHAMGNTPKEMEWLQKARTMAEGINSSEHLSEIYNIFYIHYKSEGNAALALQFHEKAVEMKDSLLNIDKINNIQNASLKVERHRQMEERARAQQELDEERWTRYVTAGVSLALILLLATIVILLVFSRRIRMKKHQQLKEMSQMRETFFTNVTHELRTPLTIMLGLNHELAKRNSLDDDTHEKLTTIDKQGQNLLLLINQLLDIAKVKSAVGEADWRNGDIVVYTGMIMETYSQYARTKGIELKFLTDEALVMDFVPDYMRKVMNNLLSNAFKFTQKGGAITVAIHRRENTAEISVADTGKGIPAEALSHLFEAFYQAESDSQSIGTGVGLTLTRQIIEAVDGTIEVESQLGQGTTFRICVPIRNEAKKLIHGGPETTNTPTIPTDEPELTDSALEQNERRILIVEDNKQVAAFIGEQLKGDYAVAYACDGKEGLAKALDIVPDLIVTDLMMPVMDGLELCRNIRQNEAVNHIPIVVITAKVTEEERVKGIEAGADAYLTKPFNSEVLRARIEALLAGRAMLRRKYASEMLGPAAETTDAQDATNTPTEPSEILSTAPRTGTAEAKAMSYAQERAEKANRRFLNRVADYVYLCIERQKKVEISDLAKHVAMSYSQFYRKMTSLTGLTPQGYVMRVKVQKAKQMMERYPEMTKAEVADKCGFADYSTFVRTFKTVEGKTPKDAVG